MNQTNSVNKMAVAPIKKLMLSMGIPMVISMILQAVYNIVDSAFVSNMSENGEEALNALTLSFPFQMLMVAVGIGTGVGANALISRSLGCKDNKKASNTAGNALFMATIIFIVFLLFGIFGVDWYISSQTSNPVIKEMAISYLRICTILSFGLIYFGIFEKMLQACGNALFSTIAQIAGALTNIILDPIMIYGLLGLPKMGVKGAAYATIIGQIVSALLGLIFHLKVNKSIDNSFKYWKPSLGIIKGIYSIGFPAIIAQALMSVMTYGLNIILVGISESAVTAYGLYYKIQQFILFASFGLRDAITPIVSFNYGMRSKKRVCDGMKYGLLYTFIVMLIGFIVIEIFASPFSDLFGLSGETQNLCISAMHIISVSFIFAGCNIALQGIFQALDGGLESLVVSICRQIVFVFPFALLFAYIIKNNSAHTDIIWNTFPIAEILSFVVAVALFIRIYKVRVKNIK
jgi:putative MATE family efflux protein